MRAKVIAVCGALLVLSGCASQVTEAGYYWGNYANTLYVYVKEPSDDTRAQHVAELEKIVEESKERELKVPPGIYAELGHIASKNGDDSKAMSYYQAEMELYPESRVFLERLTSDQN